MRSGCGGQTDNELMMGEWEPQQCTSPEMTGSPATATVAPDEWKSTMRSCGQYDLHSKNQSRRETYNW